MQRLYSAMFKTRADRLGRIGSGWHRNQFTLRQADELRVRTADWYRGNCLAWFDYRYTSGCAFIWSNLCTRHISLLPRGHHDWPD